MGDKKILAIVFSAFVAFALIIVFIVMAVANSADPRTVEKNITSRKISHPSDKNQQIKLGKRLRELYDNKGKIVAIVNDAPIYRSEVQAQIVMDKFRIQEQNEYLSELRPDKTDQYKLDSIKTFTKLSAKTKEVALHELIVQKVIELEAKKLKVAVTDDEAKAIALKRQTDLESGYSDPEQRDIVAAEYRFSQNVAKGYKMELSVYFEKIVAKREQAEMTRLAFIDKILETSPNAGMLKSAQSEQLDREFFEEYLDKLISGYKIEIVKEKKS